jgi:hypothetical protein
MSSPIDRVVKGAPPPDLSPDQIAASARAISQHSITAPIPPHHSNSSDPRDALPSSPPQIYLNLLILESSLRLQYLSLRARLRLHCLLLLALTAWVLVFTYLLFFRPREDGQGVGGSVYWVLESGEKLAWCSGVVTFCLFWGSGMYARGVHWPRRFISTTNRGLRGFNLKVVVVKGSFLAELGGWIAVLDPLGYLQAKRVNFQIVPRDIEAGAARDHWNAHAARHGLLEEDIAPGGDALRVLLLPKPFSPDFREGWDTYRQEYWEKENARRAALRAVVRAREREVARREGGWLWWTGWRGWKNVRIIQSRQSRRQMDLAKLALREKAVNAAAKRMKDRLRDDASVSSRASSRSSTPAPADGDGTGQQSRRGSVDGRRHRRASSSASSTTGAGASRRPRKGLSGNEKSRLSATETLFGDSGWDPSAMKMTEIKKEDPPQQRQQQQHTPVVPTIKVETVLADHQIKQEPEEI